MENYIIKPLDEVRKTRSSCKKIDFNSGYSSLDDYLKKYAFFNHQNGIARVFVCCFQGDNKMIYGYYSSTMHSIPTELLLSEENRRGFPKEIPVMLIGRLAVDQSSQGKGIGKILLRHGFNCAVEISEKIGIKGIFVDAIDEKAKSYYLQFGFIPFHYHSNKLFLPIETIKKAISQSLLK